MPWETRETRHPIWRPERSREPGSRGLEKKLSRPFRSHRFVIPLLPRASAFGLSPGLRSPGPLGRRTESTLSSRARRAGAEETRHRPKR